MTTTSKKANGNPPAKAEPLGDGWDEAPKASAGESDHAEWSPHFAMFSAEVIAEKMASKPEGTTAERTLIGTLRVLKAFGELRYFVETKDRTVALPLHGVLTSSLDFLRLDPAPVVRLEYKGEASRARPGERSAFLYDVRCKPSDALLPDARSDALLPIHRDNKEKREASNKKKPRKTDETDATE